MKVSRHDVIAPATLLTATGIVLTLLGSIQLNKPLGLQLIVLGRFMDLLDGPAARATRTSRFGAAFDASADKLSMAAILIAGFYYHLAPLVVLLYIVAHNVANATATIVAEKRDQKPRTPVSGKLAMFFENICLFAYFIAAIYHHRAWAIAGLVFIILSLPLGFRATYLYVKTAHA